MHQTRILKVASILAFGVSAAFSTVNLYFAAFGIINQILNAFFGIIMEFGKVTLFYKSMSARTAHKAARIMSWFVYGILLSFSIFFSMCFISNNDTEARNSLNAVENKVQKQNDLIDDDNIRLQEKQKYKAEIIAQYKSVIDIKNNLLKVTDDEDRVKALTNEIAKLTNQMQEKLAPVDVEIANIEGLKSQHLAESKTIVRKEASNGFTNMIRIISVVTGRSERTVTFLFYLILSIAFELCSSLLWYYAEHEKEQMIIIDPIVEESRPIGFNVPLALPAGVTNELLIDYVNYAWDNSDGKGRLPGYESIATELKVKPSVASKVHMYLLSNGHTATNKTKTYKVSDKEKVFEHLRV